MKLPPDFCLIHHWGVGVKFVITFQFCVRLYRNVTLYIKACVLAVISCCSNWIKIHVIEVCMCTFTYMYFNSVLTSCRDTLSFSFFIWIMLIDIWLPLFSTWLPTIFDDVCACNYTSCFFLVVESPWTWLIQAKTCWGMCTYKMVKHGLFVIKYNRCEL
jgi:hypothetical protein